MSMTAMFVQVEEAELENFCADPSSVELLFEQGDSLMPPVFLALHKTVQDRMHVAGPQMLAKAMSRLDQQLRQQIEKSMSRTNAALAGGAGGDQLMKLMQGRAARGGSAGPRAERPVLSLDKAWHGVHLRFVRRS